MDIQKLREQLSLYDSSTPRCQNKVVEHRNYSPDMIEEMESYTLSISSPCALPVGHKGACSKSRPVLGWPGLKVLNDLLDELEQLRKTSSDSIA